MRIPRLCSVDVGYGFVKAYAKSPFPSISLTTCSERFFGSQDLVDNSNPFLISYEGKMFLLGESALSKSPNVNMEGYGRWKSETYKSLMLGGIVKQLPLGNVTEDILLVTGLPYLQSKSEEEVKGIRETFTGNFEILVLEGGQLVTKRIRIVDVQVISQPRSAYYALLPITNRAVKSQLALVADLGFQTLDYLVVNNGQETNESNGEDSIAGMSRVYTSLIRELRAKGLPSVRPHELDSWLSKGYLDKYYSDIEKSFQEASETIVRDIKEKLGAFWERLGMIGHIYFVGGSAKRLQPYLSNVLNMNNVYFVENPQQLIVDGYNLYGKMVLKKVYGGV